MTEPLAFLADIYSRSRICNKRTGVVLSGSHQWQQQLARQFVQQSSDSRCFYVGQNCDLNEVVSDSAVKGLRFLGRECQILIFQDSIDFDANSFSASLGALQGGGLLIILASADESCFARKWLWRQYRELILINENDTTFSLPDYLLKPEAVLRTSEIFTQQAQAVELIKRVLFGHRRRPLVLTADRGRGKTSALGIAAAQILQSRDAHILVTAPSIKAVAPLFEHAVRLLPNSQRQDKFLLLFGKSTIRFISSDELLQSLPECDLLFVDEASAIPLPLLQAMTRHYHRCVFSTTIHGYEGAGRGFSLKFCQWLSSERPGYKQYHINVPIRWSENDPLENWLNQGFLLDSELPDLAEAMLEPLEFKFVDKSTLYAQPELFRHCFALLVNAHYQTSPNDVLMLLRDNACHLYGLFRADICVGCVCVVVEGKLDKQVIEPIMCGLRRPKGHLVPVSLACQYALTAPMQQSCVRIMRIAVHPQVQRRGLGRTMLQKLINEWQGRVDYMATSFGVTADLYDFWSESHFSPLRLGYSRDAASGCHSLIMARSLSNNSRCWLALVEQWFAWQFYQQLNTYYVDITPYLVNAFLVPHTTPKLEQLGKVVRYYAQGGSYYESVEPWLKTWLLMSNFTQPLDDILVVKVLQQKNWSDSCRLLNLSGRRELEQKLRECLSALLS